MHEARAVDVLERLAYRVLHAEPVEIAHQQDDRAELAEQCALGVVERPHADERDANRIDRGKRRLGVLERGSTKAESGREHHAGRCR